MADREATRLDLTGTVELPSLRAAQLDEIGEELRPHFAELVRQLSAPFGASLDWWVTPLASRNTYVCPLFQRLCQILLVRRLLAEGVVTDVVVDTPAMADLLTRIAPPSVRVTCRWSPLRWRLRNARSLARRVASGLYRCVGRLAFSTLIPPDPNKAPIQPIIAVDTFVSPDSIRDGILHDRYYPGLVNALESRERNRMYWVPVYYQTLDYYWLFRRLRGCQENLLIAEDYLTWRDYGFALGHFARVPRDVPECTFHGMDVTAMVREAHVESYAGSGSIEGLLRYRLAKRLREAGVQVHRVIEWFENQEVDHGAVAGWRTFFPETPVWGYQGFLAARSYLCMYPLEVEMTARLTPHVVAVMGPGLVGPAKEFCSDLNVVTAPAFRFSAVWRERASDPDPTWFTVLVSLPMMRDESRAIMDMLTHAVERLGTTSRRWRFRVKPHPTWRENDVTRLSVGLPTAVQLVAGPFDEAVDCADALVSAASSTCVHAIARGVPVAVVGRPGTPAQNPIPRDVDGSLWAICYTGDDLARVLAGYAGADLVEVERRRRLGCRYRESLFSLVTPGSVREFLGLVEASEFKAPDPASVSQRA